MPGNSADTGNWCRYDNQPVAPVSDEDDGAGGGGGDDDIGCDDIWFSSRLEPANLNYFSFIFVWTIS